MHLTNAIELLTSQHDEIEALLVEVAATGSDSVHSGALSELADKLTLHLAVEQELLYPAADPLITPEVHAELLAEHGEIKRILADLIWLEREDQRFAQRLVSLQALLQVHETWQELELFVRLARGLPAPRLENLDHDVHSWFDRTVDSFAA